MSLAAGFELIQELSSVVFYLLYVDNSDGLGLKEYRKGQGDHLIKWGGKTLLDLVDADDLSILDESVSKMNELFGRSRC